MIRIDPDSAVGYYNLASALADLDKDEESAAALREVVRINPNHYNAHYNLGELFRLESKFDESTQAVPRIPAARAGHAAEPAQHPAGHGVHQELRKSLHS